MHLILNCHTRQRVERSTPPTPEESAEWGEAATAAFRHAARRRSTWRTAIAAEAHRQHLDAAGTLEQKVSALMGECCEYGRRLAGMDTTPEAS